MNFGLFFLDDIVQVVFPHKFLSLLCFVAHKFASRSLQLARVLFTSFHIISHISFSATCGKIMMMMMMMLLRLFNGISFT